MFLSNMVRILILQFPNLGPSIFERSIAESQLLLDQVWTHRGVCPYLCLSKWCCTCLPKIPDKFDAQGVKDSLREGGFETSAILLTRDRSLFLASKCVVTGTDLDLVLLDPADLLYHSVSKSLMKL